MCACPSPGSCSLFSIYVSLFLSLSVSIYTMCSDPCCPCIQGCIAIFNCAKGIDDDISTLRQDHAHSRDGRPRLIDKIQDMEVRSNGNPVIEGWLRSAREEREQLDDILGPEESPKPLPSHCLCCHLYCCGNLGREMHERRVRLDTLLDDNNPPQTGALRQTESVLPLAAVEMIGMDSKFRDFWELFDDESVRIIGIQGMPGAGKSAFLMNVNDEFSKPEKLRGFDKVIWIGSSPTTRDIVEGMQRTIADRLGLQSLQDSATRERVGAIREGLMRSNFVLLLDNPPDQLQLQDIGVPSNPAVGKKFKVVFTAQRTGILSNLSPPPRAFDLGLLDKQSATRLFNSQVGEETLNADQTIRDLADTIVDMCSGLPIALIRIGEHMRNKNSPADWKDTIERLNCPESAGPERSVYQHLSGAYRSLASSDQTCFLYCCLFPSGHPMEEGELKRHWLAEGFLGNGDLLDCLGRGDSILDTLKRAHLLMSARDQLAIEMHHQIYNLARWISSGHLPEVSQDTFYVWSNSNVELVELPKGHDWGRVERISLVDTTVRGLNKIGCSRLSTLILKHCIIKNISRDFFDPMAQLKVLNLSQSKLPMIPRSIARLTSLRYLNLSGSNISELPDDFKHLRKLQALDLSFTKELEKIAAGVLSNFSALQWLNMYYCGVGRRTQRGSSSSPLELMALLNEVQGLQSLRDVGITIRSSTALTKLGEFCHLKNMHSIQITDCEAVQLPVSTSAAPGLEVNLASIASAESLKVLHITKCWALVIFRETSIRTAPHFQNLCDIKIEDCWKLTDLTWLRHPQALESLEIGGCPCLTKLFAGEAAGQPNQLPFSNLKYLHLKNLSKLEKICFQDLPFKELMKITVLSCSKLMGMSIDVGIARQNPIPIICQELWWEKNLNEATKSKLSPFFETRRSAGN